MYAGLASSGSAQYFWNRQYDAVPPVTPTSPADFELGAFRRPENQFDSPISSAPSSPALPVGPRDPDAQNHVKRSGSSQNFREYGLAAVLWLGFVGVTITSWYIYHRLGSKPSEYGIGTQWTASCDNLQKSLKTWNQLALLAINVVAGFVTLTASYFRTGLLAPSPSAFLKSTQPLYLAVDSWRGFARLSILRKILYIVLLFSSLPVHFM